MASRDERLYKADEIRQIFERASSESAEPTGDSLDALTLAELQSIGQEVGIAPDRIVRAAQEVEWQASVSHRRSPHAVPVVVQQTVMLPRFPTPKE